MVEGLQDGVFDLSLLIGDTGRCFLRIAEEDFDQMVCVWCSKVRGTVDSDEIEDSIVLFLGEVGVEGKCVGGVGEDVTPEEPTPVCFAVGFKVELRDRGRGWGSELGVGGRGGGCIERGGGCDNRGVHYSHSFSWRKTWWEVVKRS